MILTPVMKKKLILFDFDGTLTKGDSMFAFINFAKGEPALWGSLILLSPWLVLQKLGLYPAEKAKKKLLAFHFKGETAHNLEEMGKAFGLRVLPNLFRDMALEKLHFHRSKGHEVWIVTASLDIWVGPWAQQQGLPILCTKAEFVDGKFTGEFSTPNCNGPEKVRRIEEVLQREDFERVYAYGDSRGDKEMLAYAHTGFYRRYI
jgi:phosphatidylglycerophosphatase C